MIILAFESPSGYSKKNNAYVGKQKSGFFLFIFAEGMVERNGISKSKFLKIFFLNNKN
jgi:hypothetical protein